jgi:hypothetical protein
MDELKGTEITAIRPHYEHIVVHTDKTTYFISSEELVAILSEFDFIREKKRTRTWLRLVLGDWRVEKFKQPRTY